MPTSTVTSPAAPSRAPTESTVTASTTDAKPSATPGQTRERLAKLSGRGYTVIRNNFVQERQGGQRWVGSALGRLVAARQPRALLAYLLLLMTWSAMDKRPTPLEAQVWARALSPDPPATQWPATAMSRVWSALEDHRLIERERRARLVKLTPRKENGKAPYVRPRPDESTKPSEKYFILPDAFWLEGWHQRLGLPGIAVLLIVLAGTTGRDEAWLSPEHAQSWYGISEKTMRNGLEELRQAELLNIRREWIVEELSAIGRTQKMHCSLTGPFSRTARADLQAIARKETRRRVAKKASAEKRRAKTVEAGA